MAGLILINVALGVSAECGASIHAYQHQRFIERWDLALFASRCQTGVIMLEYINQLRAAGHTRGRAAIEGAVLRLRRS